MGSILSRMTGVAFSFLGALALAYGCSASGSDDDGKVVDASTIDSALAPPPFSDDACVADPGNFDILGDGCDNDGDGQVDNKVICDTDFTAASGIEGSADDFARALGLCQRSSGPADPKWGLVSATFMKGVATESPPTTQHRLMPKFGDVLKPREGAALGVLSTGYAREYDHGTQQRCNIEATAPNGCFNTGLQMQPGVAATGAAPPGYPRGDAECGIDPQVYDPIAIKLVIRTPKNARNFSVDFDFLTGEWPRFVCSRFNDSFLAYLTSQSFNGGVPENIAFDSKNAPITVNSGFFDRCSPNAMTGCAYGADGGADAASAILKGPSSCSGGPDELKGTGFYALGKYCDVNETTGGGATGWLTAHSPIAGGEVITLYLMIWDTGDPSFDSIVLLDHFLWSEGESEPGVFR